MAKQTTGVVVVNQTPTSNNKHVMLRLTRQRVGIFFVVMIFIAAGLYVLLQHTVHKPNASKPSQVNSTQLNQQVSGLIKGHKLSQAETALKNQNATFTSESGYLTLALVQTGEYKYGDAITTLKQAQTKYGMSYVLAVQFAQTYSQKQDYKDAISYYQQAIQSLQKDPSQVPNSAQAITSLQNSINTLSKAKT